MVWISLLVFYRFRFRSRIFFYYMFANGYASGNINDRAFRIVLFFVSKDFPFVVFCFPWFLSIIIFEVYLKTRPLVVFFFFFFLVFGKLRNGNKNGLMLKFERRFLSPFKVPFFLEIRRSKFLEFSMARIFVNWLFLRRS